MNGLAEALGARGRRAIYLVGSGGKTSTMFALARELSRRARVVCSTSTRLARPSLEQSPSLLICDDVDRARREIGELLVGPGLATLVHSAGARDKFHGHGLDDLDALARSDAADIWLIEADGSAGRPLKAHAHYEPVISPRADLVITVVGAGVLGRPLTEQWVHRSALARSRLGKDCTAQVTCEDVARLVLHRDGGLRTAFGEVSLFVAGAGSRREAAVELADVIREADGGRRLTSVAVGELGGVSPWVERLAGAPSRAEGTE